MKNLLLLIALLTPFMAEAQNYFQTGMKWVMEGSSSDKPGPVILKSTVTIEGDTTVNGVDALKMYEESERTDSKGTHVWPKALVAVVRNDGEKVLFWHAATEQWLLAYDFGLKQGDRCLTYNLSEALNKALPYCAYVEFGATETVPGSLYLEQTEVTEFDDEEPTLEYCKGIWIKGIGSTAGVLYNNMQQLDGFGYRLSEAYDKEKLIYKNYKAAIGEVATEEPALSVTGRNVLVKVAGAETISAYTTDGIRVAEVSAADGCAELALPKQGIYLVKCGARTVKVAVK